MRLKVLQLGRVSTAERVLLHELSSMVRDARRRISMTPHSSHSPSRPLPATVPHASSRAKRFTPRIALADRVPYPAGLALIEQTANSSSFAADDSTRDLWAIKKTLATRYAGWLLRYLAGNLRKLALALSPLAIRHLTNRLYGACATYYCARCQERKLCAAPVGYSYKWRSYLRSARKRSTV